MRICKSKRVITLGRTETRIWQSSAPEAYELRDKVRRRAREMVTVNGGHSVEVYACKRADGWMADQIEAESQIN